MSKRNQASIPVAVNKGPSPGAVYVKQGQQLIREGKEEEGVALLHKAIVVEPNNAMWHFEIGRHCLQRHKDKEGIKHLQKALSLDDDLTAAQISLGQAYAGVNRYDEALPLLRAAIGKDGGAPQAHLAYASYLHKRGQLEQAVVHFRIALEHVLTAPVRVAAPKQRKDFNTPKTEEVMWATLSLLARAGVHVFAAYGTLLGLTREGGLLPFDKDIDFGLPHNELEKACQCLKAHGWLENPGSFLTNPRALVNPMHDVSLDLAGFVVDGETGNTYTGFWMDGIDQEWARNDRYPPVALIKGESPAGEPLWKLRDPEAWLQAVYGDWRTPDPDFDTVIAAKNLCSFSLMTQCYAFGRIYARWEKGRLDKALALVRHTRRHLPDDDLMRKVEMRFVKLLQQERGAGGRAKVSAAAKPNGKGTEG